MSPIKLVRIYLLCSLSISACVKQQTSASTKEAWNAANDPLKLGDGYQRVLSTLPLSGQTQLVPWADTYWPSKEGGISARWYNLDSYYNTKENFTYQTKTLAQLKNMTISEIASLSPAEKLDIANADYSYPTVAIERDRTSPEIDQWEGICHGWASASLIYSEPKAVQFKNKDGIVIDFGSSDVKGLLSYYVGQISTNKAKMLGKRCEIDLKTNPIARNSPECRDTNAGAFHIVLTNFLGIRKQGFVADITKDIQVWNHPIYEFTSKINGEKDGASPKAAKGTVKEVTVTTKIKYRIESVPSYETIGSIDYFSKTKTYQYRLEINVKGEIIGGEWLTDDRPDFLWTKDRPEFEGNYNVLGELYKNATEIVSSPTPSPSVDVTVTSMPVIPVLTPTAIP